MNDWVIENVPKGEKILAGHRYSNYQIFLDGGRHGWALLQVDCERGQTNPGKTGCVPSHTIAEAPPKPTVWFWMENDCKAIALSMPTLIRQMEWTNSDYVIVGSNFNYPGILGSVPYLVGSGAFKVVHEEKLDPHVHTGVAQGMVLLKSIDEVPKTLPTSMDANTVSRLVRCEAAKGPGYIERVRSKFPHGIALEPLSSRAQAPGEAAQRNAEAQEAIERIYGKK